MPIMDNFQWTWSVFKVIFLKKYFYNYHNFKALYLHEFSMLESEVTLIWKRILFLYFLLRYGMLDQFFIRTTKSGPFWLVANVHCSYTFFKYNLLICYHVFDMKLIFFISRIVLSLSFIIQMAWLHYLQLISLIRRLVHDSVPFINNAKPSW